MRWMKGKPIVSHSESTVEERGSSRDNVNCDKVKGEGRRYCPAAD